MGLIKKGPRFHEDQSVEILKSLILILAEVACLPQFLQTQHMKGLCTSLSPHQFLACFGKNPLLVKCTTCRSCYCIVCYEKFHMNHETQFLLHQSPMFRCNSENDSTTLYSLDFKLPKYNSQIGFCDNFEKLYKHQSDSRII